MITQGRLILFNRRIDIASDDLYIPACIITIFRIVWIPILATTLAIVKGCFAELSNLLILHLVLASIGFLNSTIGWYHSLQGTIKNPEPRKYMGLLAHVEVIVTLLDYSLQFYGFYVLFDPQPSQTSTQCIGIGSVSLTRMVLVWAFVYDTMFFIVLGLLIYSSKSTISADRHSYIRLWKRRVEWFVKSPSAKTSESDEVIAEVSTTLAHYFKETDWAPSDMAVGLLLLKREQKIIQRVTEWRALGIVHDSFTTLSLVDIGLASKAVPISIDSETDYSISPIDDAGPLANVDQSIELKSINDDNKEGIDVKSISSSATEKPEKQFTSRESLAMNDSRNSMLSNVERFNSRTDIRMHADPSKTSLASSIGSPTRVNSFLGRKSEFQLRDREDFLVKNRSKSFSIDFRLEKDQEEQPSVDWKFASYAFTLDPHAKLMTRPDILDVIHFTHYANMAYVELDSDIQKKADILIHYSPFNDLFRAPYLVSLDHDWCSIVIAIRGTYSAADLLVDLKIEAVELDADLPNPEKNKVHSGFLLTALNIVHEIISKNIIEDIKSNTHSKASDYQIVVCGHSLGAAVGSLVAYFLRKKGYQNTFCYGYSMPGSVMNEAAASLFNDFCISIVAGDDLISRIGTYALDILKKDVKRCLENCDLAKYKIFGSAIGNYYMHRKNRKSLLQRTQNGTLPDSKTDMLQQSEIERIQNATLSIPRRWRIGNNHAHLQHIETSENFVPMYIPGRILYLEKIRDHAKIFDPKEQTMAEEPKRKRGQYSLQRFTDAVSERIKILHHRSVDCKYAYAPRWADKEEFLEITVSRSMVSDHTIVFGIMKEFESFKSDVPLRALS